MKISDKIEMLEVPMNLMGTQGTIYPTIIWTDEHVVLVDAGTSDSLPFIQDAMNKAGAPFNKIDTIIVTHQDIDHIGGINNIINELKNVKVLAHVVEKPYIQGEKQLVRLKSSKIMDRINALPDDERIKVLEMFENISVKVDEDLTDGYELDCCGGVTVIHTPGHTPGHICIYHEESKCLIVGDALNIEDEKLVITHKEAMNERDLDVIKGWLEKFSEFDVEYLISYHQGLFQDNPNQKIKELIESLN